jgi:hypothetical protein
MKKGGPTGYPLIGSAFANTFHSTVVGLTKADKYGTQSLDKYKWKDFGIIVKK